MFQQHKGQLFSSRPEVSTVLSLHLLQSLAVVQSTDPEDGILDLQKVIHSSYNAIIPVKMATTARPLFLFGKMSESEGAGSGA